MHTFTLFGVGGEGHVGEELHEVLAQSGHDVCRIQRGKAPGHGHRQCPHRAALVVQRHKQRTQTAILLGVRICLIGSIVHMRLQTHAVKAPALHITLYGMGVEQLLPSHSGK